MDSRAPSQYPKRRLSVRSRKVSKPRDWYFKLSYRFEIWQAHRQHCCRSACQISERSDNSKYKSRGFETLRDLTERRLFGYWDGALDPTTRVLGLIAYPAVVVLGRWHSMGTHGRRHRHRHWHTHTDTHTCVCIWRVTCITSIAFSNPIVTLIGNMNKQLPVHLLDNLKWYEGRDCCLPITTSHECGCPGFHYTDKIKMRNNIAVDITLKRLTVCWKAGRSPEHINIPGCWDYNPAAR